MLALPRGAAGWVLRQARTVLSAIGSNPVLQRLGARLSEPRRPDPVGRPDHRHGGRPEHPRRLAGHRPSRAVRRLQDRRRRQRLVAADPLTARQARPDRHPHRQRTRHAPARWSADWSSASPPTRSPRPSSGAWPPSPAWSARSARASSSTGSWAWSVGASWLRWAVELLALPLVIAPSLVVDLGAGLRRPRSVPLTSVRPGHVGEAASVATADDDRRSGPRGANGGR